MTIQSLGLVAFVLTTLIITAVLGWDLHRYLTNQVTVTAYCRANPWLAWILLTLIEMGVVGLAIHFMTPTPR